MFWKKGDLSQAKTCFTSALKVESNKESLRSLSMLLRSLPTGSAFERTANIEESLVMAKDALKHDHADGRSWFVLGNACVYPTPLLALLLCVCKRPPRDLLRVVALNSLDA